MDVEAIHHVTLPVSDIDSSRRFYAEILGLREIDRPPFDFPGAWCQVGPNHIHLVVGDDPTFRESKHLDSRDIHFAVRVTSFRATLELLEAKGYGEDANDELMKMKVSLRATAGFPQIYILDPDRNVIEINAAELD